MDSKSLKKQLGAAIAMVLVAAVALGSATYAWFVTNNEVKATTTNISAQSNAAFMTIAKGLTGAKDADTTNVTTGVATKALYPATYGEEKDSTKGTWMTAFGTSLTEGARKGGLIKCKDPNGTAADGTTAAAIAGDFILDQDFNISCKSGQTLSDLKVAKVEAGTTAGKTELNSALRVLVTNADGTSYAVYGLNDAKSAYELKLSSEDSTSTEVVYAETISSDKDTAVHVYLYYEGSDSNVTTQNLVEDKLDASNNVTVTFTAKANNK